MSNLIDELRWRGLLQDITPETEAFLKNNTTAGYIGFDPTADSLHIGSLVQIILLMHLQRFGNKPIALVGGATGMVGDPSGKSKERNMLSATEIEKNVAGIEAQLKRFINFDSTQPNAAELVNNYDWYKNFTFLDFIRDVGKHITVNYMLAKDSVKLRLENEQGMSFTEFTYQLVQGYDFYWLFKNKGVKLQVGGSDQWGNIVTGMELIRKKDGEDAYAFTAPLIKKADGTKFGKTEQGNIWLDATKTSPYEFYQFWINAGDDDAKSWIKVFTFLDQPTIEELIEQHSKQPEKRLLQKKLAQEVTQLVHGTGGLQEAEETTQQLFSKQHQHIQDFTEEDLESIDGITKVKLSKSLLGDYDLYQLVTDATIAPSKSEAKKLIAGGGVSMNKEKQTNAYAKITNANLLYDKYILLQKGKKHYYLAIFE